MKSTQIPRTTAARLPVISHDLILRLLPVLRRWGRTQRPRLSTDRAFAERGHPLCVRLRTVLIQILTHDRLEGREAGAGFVALMFQGESLLMPLLAFFVGRGD